MRTFIFVCFFSVFLTACQAKDVKVLEITQAIPIGIEDHKFLASLQFDRLEIKIRHGTIIGSYEMPILGLSDCVFVDQNIFWNQGRILLHDLEMSYVFSKLLKMQTLTSLVTQIWCLQALLTESQNQIFFLADRLKIYASIFAK